MKRFRVVSKISPAIRIDGGIHFTFQQTDGTDSIVYIVPNEFTVKEGTKFQTGWTVFNDLYAETVDDAKIKSGSHIDGLLSCASLVSGVPLQVVDPSIVFSTQVGESNDFIQFMDSGPVPSRRILNGELFIELISKIQDPPKPEYTDRITRAIRWFRMGTLVPHDILTSYDCFWKGLESLNKPLTELLDAPQEYNICSKCGKQTKRPTTGGIKKFLTDKYPEGDDLYKQFRNIRVKIVHSTEKISEIMPVVHPVVEKLALILYDAILFVLEIENKTKYHSILSTKSGIAIEGKVEIDNEDYLTSLAVPYFIPQIEIADVIKVDDKLTLTYNGKFKINLPDGYGLSVNGMRQYGQEMSGFAIQEVKKTNGTKVEG